jgi:hypothetical protein
MKEKHPVAEPTNEVRRQRMRNALGKESRVKVDCLNAERRNIGHVTPIQYQNDCKSQRLAFRRDELWRLAYNEVGGGGTIETGHPTGTYHCMYSIEWVVAHVNWQCVLVQKLATT